MIRRALTTLTVSLTLATAYPQSTKTCQSPALKPSAAIPASKRKPAAQHAKPSAATTIPASPISRKPSAVLPTGVKASVMPPPTPAAVVIPPFPTTAATSLSAPLIVPRPRDISVHPNLEFVPTSNVIVRDMHLRPLFTSTIHVGEAVTSLVVGAPTLFQVEHKDSEPTLIFVKPSTHLPAESNLLIALASGETISIRLISPGDAGSTDPTDFVVDYRGRKSMFESQAVVLGTPGSNSSGDATENGRDMVANEHSSLHTDISAPKSPAVPSNTESALDHEFMVGAPHWVTVPELAKLIKENALAPNCIAIAIGDIRQEGGNMVVSFSVLNISHHWVSIMPPQIELTNPLLKKKDARKHGSFAQPIASIEFKLDNPKLSPGARSDGSITFQKPDTKIAKESLLLHIATSASIDTPVYYPLPFVAPSSEEIIAQQGGADARTN